MSSIATRRLFLLSAATLLPLGAGILNAADITETQTIYNLKDEDYTLTNNNTILTIDLSTESSYSKKISGGDSDNKHGYIYKIGEGRLDFSGELKNLNGFQINEGIGTLLTGAKITSTPIYLGENGTLIINSLTDTFNDAHINTGQDKKGNIEYLSAITTTIESINANSLKVRAGTLIFKSDANFNNIYVNSNATLQIGIGDNRASLSGDITLEKDAALNFNFKTTASITYGESISGAGNVSFKGEGDFYFQKDQSYTGETDIQGISIIGGNAAAPISIASSKITLSENGTITENLNLYGDVFVKGKYNLASEDNSSKNGGIISLQQGNTPLAITIHGNLTLDPAYLEYGINATGTEYEIKGINRGGIISVLLSESGSALLDIKGTASLPGTLDLNLDSPEKITAKKIYPFLRAEKFKTDDNGDILFFRNIIRQSENIILVSPNVGGLANNEYGVAYIENIDLDKRLSNISHNGLNDLINYLEEENSSSSYPNEIVQTLHLSDDENLAGNLNNLSALPYASVLGMGVKSSNLEVDVINHFFAKEIKYPYEKNRYDIERNWSYFSSYYFDYTRFDNSKSSPTYDIDSVGILAGTYNWIDNERIAGFSLGLNQNVANIHDNGGDIRDTSFRLRAFSVFTPKNDYWKLLIGVSAGGHSFDSNRKNFLGENHANFLGYELGGFLALSKRNEYGNNWANTPFIRFDYNYIHIDSFSEKGNASALKINRFGYSSYKLRVGSSIDYSWGIPGDVAYFGIDFATAIEFGQDPNISTSFKKYNNSHHNVSATVDERLSFEITPRYDWILDDNWKINCSLKNSFDINGGRNHAFIISVGKQF